MVLNVLVDGIFPVEMSEVQKDIGIDFYTKGYGLPNKDINVVLWNKPVNKPSFEDAIEKLQLSAERKGIWINHNFASSDDYDNIYDFKIADRELGKYYESYRHNFWDFIFSAHLSYISSRTFPIDLRKMGKPLQVKTADGKILEIERISIPEKSIKTSTCVTEESPFNLPANFQVNIDYPGKVGRELFYTEPYGSHYFHAKSVLKRRIEILKPPLSIEKIREFKIDDIDARILTEESLQKVLSALPPFAYETVGIMNYSVDRSKIDWISNIQPAGLIHGTVGSLLENCEEYNVKYTTQALLTLGQRTGGYITQKRKKIHEVVELQKESEVRNQFQTNQERKKIIPFPVYDKE